MQDILIIGAGGVGRVVAHKCAQQTDVFGNITLASRTVAKCDQIASEVKEKTGKRIATASVDADKVPELVALIKKIKPFMVINVALPYQDLSIMNACLETGVHYMDTANYEPLDEAKFESSGFWRGDTWPATTYLTSSGLNRYGYHDLARRLALSTWALAEEKGVNEHYDCRTGAPLGNPSIGM